MTVTLQELRTIGSRAVLALLLASAVFGGIIARALPHGSLLSELVLGARGTVVTSAVVLFSSPVVALSLSGVAALGPRALDSLLSRAVEITSALPSVVAALVLSRASGMPAPLAIGLSLSMLRGLQTAKAVRAELRALAVTDFALAARALGSGETRLFLSHLLPHVVPTVASTSVLTASSAVALEGTLSFLGLGSLGPSWGALLSTSVREGTPLVGVAPVALTLAAMLALHEVARGIDAHVGVGRRFV